VTILRNAQINLKKFTDYFKGFDKVEAVKKIFGEETEKVLGELKVEFYSSRFSYMGVSGDDGHLLVSTYYLVHGSERDIYLDIIHELVHVKQFMNGKELFDDRYAYVDRPTEIEAYKITVSEAKRIRMTDQEIIEYLKTEWMRDNDLSRLSNILNLTKS
jgi:hypothetical protein